MLGFEQVDSVEETERGPLAALNREQLRVDDRGVRRRLGSRPLAHFVLNIT